MTTQQAFDLGFEDGLNLTPLRQMPGYALNLAYRSGWWRSQEVLDENENAQSEMTDDEYDELDALYQRTLQALGREV